MVPLAIIGIGVLVAVVAVGAYWLIKSVRFKSNEKENSND
jgi:membrane-associated protease RseP (regulator of RpoE activity)